MTLTPMLLAAGYIDWVYPWRLGEGVQFYMLGDHGFYCPVTFDSPNESTTMTLELLPDAYMRHWGNLIAQEDTKRRLSKLRIKGPINGRLFVCYDWRKPGRCATATSAEGALAAWKSYWSDKS